MKAGVAKVEKMSSSSSSPSFIFSFKQHESTIELTLEFFDQFACLAEWLTRSGGWLLEARGRALVDVVHIDDFQSRGAFAPIDV